MLFDLKKFRNKNKIISDKKAIKKIKKSFEKSNKDVSDFTEKFLFLAKRYSWSWYNKEINEENIKDQIARYSWRMIKKEMEYFDKNGKWSDHPMVRYISSGRISVMFADFEENKDHIWVELDVLTTL